MPQPRGESGSGKIDFGDFRLETRMNIITEKFIEKPNTSIPQAFESFSQVKACYNFFDNEKVTPKRILQPQIKKTVSEASGEAMILAVQDTSEADFSTHDATQGLGYLESSRQRGIKVHTCIAVRTDGQPLGLLWQRQWERPFEEYGKKAQRRQKPIEEKESRRWLDCHNDVNRMLPEDTNILHVADRESDIYEYLSAPRTESQFLLLRFAQDRRIDGGQKRIKSALNASPIAGRFLVSVGRHGGEPTRVAELSIKYVDVNILPPAYLKSGISKTSVSVTAIKAYEENAGIEWYLLTTLPVSGIEDVRQCVRYYSMRWLIERFHYTLKSGCQVEKLQLETARRLENAIAIYSVVAFHLLNLTYLARTQPELDAREYFTEDEIMALQLKFDPDQKYEHPTIMTAMIWIACLGGFQNRKDDGMPGVKTIWRGTLALQYFVLGFTMARDIFAKFSKNSKNSSHSRYP